MKVKELTSHQESEATGAVCQSTCEAIIQKSHLPFRKERGPPWPLPRLTEMSQEQVALEPPLTTVAHSPLLANPT